MRVFGRWCRPLLSAALLFSTSSAAAQTDSLNRAYDLERRGNYAGAVTAYRAVLRSRPAEVGAILGLERSLQPLNRGAEIVPELSAAIAANRTSTALQGVAIRTWTAQGIADSARRAVDRWAELAPGDEAPWREWGNALLLKRERASARAAYVAGRERLGQPDALAAELAQVMALEGDYAGAAREWLVAMRKLPGYRSSAIVTLRQVPEPQRKEVLRALEQAGTPDARRLEAELRARWGDPLGAFDRLSSSLPPADAEAVELLRQFTEALRGQQAPEYRRAMGRTLEALAGRSRGAAAARLRLDAAQAYLDGGDRPAARRMLGGLADGADVPPALAASASTTLLRLLIEEGNVIEAERRFATLQKTLPAEQRADASRRLALAWARQGQLARADSILLPDSSVAGLALRGRLRLFSGDVGGAVELLKAAGPYAGTREEATERTALLALLQPLEAEEQPKLGAAFLSLEQGDTARAVRQFTELGRTLPAGKGGAELTLLAGQLEARRGRGREAETLLRAAVDSTAPAAAPAALLELGRLLAQSGRNQEAVPVLEELILSYPRSALVPQARRALDDMKGAVPQ